MKIKNKKIYFASEKLPYNIMALSDRFIIASRRFNKRQDANILWHSVEMGAFTSFTEAYKMYKDFPIYTIVDIKNWVRGASNMIFDDIDYSNEESCLEALMRLTRGEMEISKRSMVNVEYPLDFHEYYKILKNYGVKEKVISNDRVTFKPRKL